MARPNRPTCGSRLLAVVTVALGGLLAGCSTPRVAHDGYATGRLRVVALLNEAGTALPPALGFHRVTLANTDRELCHKKFLGYAVGTTGARQPEVTGIVNVPETTDTRALLPRIEAMWRTRGYRIDRSGLDDPRFPKVRAHTGDYTVVATSFSNSGGFKDRPRITLYAVGDCMK